MKPISVVEAYGVHEGNKAAREYIESIRYQMLAKGRPADAVLLSKKFDAPSRVQMLLVEKANPGVSVDASGSWGSPLASSLSTAFLGSLSTAGYYDAIVPFSVRLPLLTRVTLITGISIGEQISESSLKPVGDVELENDSLGAIKVAAQIVMSEELLRLAGEGVTTLMAGLRQAVALATDTAWVNVITDAVTPIPSSGDLLVDLRMLVSAIQTDVGSKIFVGLSPNLLKTIALNENPMFDGLSVTSGGRVRGLQFVPTSALADTEMMAVDAQSAAMNAGVIDTAGTGQAVIDMGVGTPISLFQVNARAARSERVFGGALLRSTGAALVNNISYTGS